MSYFYKLIIPEEHLYYRHPTDQSSGEEESSVPENSDSDDVVKDESQDNDPNSVDVEQNILDEDLPSPAVDHDDNPNQPVGISISSDGMEASAIVRVDGAVSSSAILTALQDNGITVGIDEAAVDILASKYGPRGYPHVVATGDGAEAGRDASLELFFDSNPQPKITYNEQGHADYKEVGIIQQVKEGSLLVRKTPPEEGNPGLTVTGKAITSRPGKDMQLSAGMGTRLEVEGNELVAAQNGVVSMRQGNLVTVSKEFVIDGDVDFKSGNIRFDGAVRILGNVIGGFSVIASGDVEINGVVEDAYIHCGGNLHIRGGFLGRGKGIAKVCGETHIRFLENQSVICSGDVHIAEEIIFGNVKCDGEVFVRYGKGAIIGGVVSAAKGIQAKTAGNMHNQRTWLITGRNEHVSNQLVRATKAMNVKQDMRDLMQAALDNLVPKKYDNKYTMSQEEIDALDVLYRHMASLDKWTDEISSIRDELDTQASSLEDHAYVLIENHVHTGVKITIGDVARLIEEEIPRTRFRLADGFVIASSAQDNQ
jgi:uncharacterized protein